MILLNALFQGGRLFVGAICVLYFLSFGLQMGDYAWIKTTQAIIFIGLDIPLGYLLTRIGEYKSLLLSIAFGMIGALGYLVFTSFFGFLISETFLALSLSTWPVALSAYSMRVLENYKTEGLIERFFHFGDAVSNIFVVICGSLGGIFYAFNKYIPYSCFFIFYLLAAISTVIYLKGYKVIRIERKEPLKFLISNIKEMRSILPFASVLFFAQFFMQPLFHYWQPLFGEKFAVSSENMSIVFISYSFAMSSISWGYSRMTHLTILRSNLFVISAAIIGGLAYSLVAKMNNFSISLIFFALSFGIFNLVQIASSILIQNRLKQENRMIINKYVSFYSRIGMITSLVTLHWLFANKWETSEVYKLYGNLTTLVFCCCLGWIAMQKNAEKNMFVNPRVESTSYISITDYKKHEQQVRLKTFTSADIDDFMEWATDDEVTKYMMWNSYTSRSEAESFFANIVEKHPWFKAICLGKKVIGSITLDKGKGAHSCKAELGYVIARQYWGNGWATQAIKLVIETGFEDLNIERVEAYVDPANTGSQKVLEKNGFFREGLLKKCIIQNGIVKDRFLYSYLKSAY